MNGYIYLLHTGEFVKANMNVYKPGRTNNINRRMKEYPFFTEQKLLMEVDDCVQMEAAILNQFKNNYRQCMEYGREYFEGDVNEMIKLIEEIINKITSGQASYSDYMNFPEEKMYKIYIRDKKSINEVQAESICDSELITYEQYNILKKGNIGLSDHNQIDRYLLANTYENSEIDEEFVLKYSDISIRRVYIHLCMINNNSIDIIENYYNLMKNEMPGELSKYYENIAQRYKYVDYLLKYVGFDTIFDDKVVTREQLLKNLNDGYDEFVNKYEKIRKVFKKDKRNIVNKNTDKFLGNMLKLINPYFEMFYGFTVKHPSLNRVDRDKFIIVHKYHNVIFDDDGPKLENKIKGEISEEECILSIEKEYDIFINKNID